MGDYLFLFGCLGFLIIPTLFTWMTARWILGPISRAARYSRCRTQYRIIDFFCLIVEMQAVTAVVVAVTESNEPRARFPLLIFGALAVLALWVGGVRTLSRAGILDPWRRTVFNWVVLPAASIGSLVLVPLVVWLIGHWIDQRNRDVPIVLWLLAATLAAALLLSKWLAVWVLAELKTAGASQRAATNLDPQATPVVGPQADDEPIMAERVLPAQPDPPPPVGNRPPG